MPSENVPESVDGIPVKTVDKISVEEKNNNLVIISYIEGLQDDIYIFLKQNGFKNVIYYDRRFLSLSIKERNYFNQMYGWNINVSVPMLEKNFYEDNLDLKIYVVTSHLNLHKSRGNILLPKYSTFIQGGAALTETVMCELRDNLGENNISYKNPMYCELTALYWIIHNEKPHEFMGLNFYSRIFDLNEDQIKFVLMNGIEAILPEPAVLMPQFIFSNGSLKDYLKKALTKVCPSYVGTFEIIRREKICVPSNIFICKKEIFYDYSKWLFKVLEVYENLLIENEEEIPPRHYGYVAEGLQTLYFLHNSSDLNILFARRKFLC